MDEVSGGGTAGDRPGSLHSYGTRRQLSSAVAPEQQAEQKKKKKKKKKRAWSKDLPSRNSSAPPQ